MKRMLVLGVVPLVVTGLCSACGNQPPAESVSGQAAASKSPKPAAATLRITGLLVKKDGSSVPGKTIVAYPLDRKGNPVALSVQMPGTTPGFVSIETWNPKGKSDSTGRFTMQAPGITRINEDRIEELVFSIGEPPGGWQTTTVVKVVFADPARKPEKGFQSSSDKVSLLRRDGQVLKVRIRSDWKQLDLGRIPID